MSVTKYGLVDVVTAEVGPKITRKDVGIIVDRFLTVLAKTLAEGNRVELRGFGVFMSKVRRERLGRNPRTREPVRIPSRLVPVFKPSRILMDMVSQR